MGIRDLILTRNNPEQSQTELETQWREMAGVINPLLNETTVTRDGILRFNDNNSASTASATISMTDALHTVSMNASGKTVFLPSASANRVGLDWTVNLSTPGMVTVTANGSDTICTPSSATDTSVDIVTLGDSITFRCVTATSWIMV